MEYEMNPYIVYVRTNSGGHITAVNSSAFLTDTIGWTEIDSGYGEKYRHAQGNYFPEALLTDGGAWHYKFTEGVLSACTEAEIKQQEMNNRMDLAPTQEERIAELEQKNEMLTQCLLELSEIVYA